jgi:hypothetical protein
MLIKCDEGPVGGAGDPALTPGYPLTPGYVCSAWAHVGQPGQISAAVRLQADRIATEPNPGTV